MVSRKVVLKAMVCSESVKVHNYTLSLKLPLKVQCKQDTHVARVLMGCL